MQILKINAVRGIRVCYGAASVCLSELYCIEKAKLNIHVCRNGIQVPPK